MVVQVDIDMENTGTFKSTGEAAKIIGRSNQHCKHLAQLNGINVVKIGKRGDWIWTDSQIESVKRLVQQGVWK